MPNSRAIRRRDQLRERNVNIERTLAILSRFAICSLPQPIIGCQGCDSESRSPHVAGLNPPGTGWFYMPADRDLRTVARRARFCGPTQGHQMNAQRSVDANTISRKRSLESECSSFSNPLRRVGYIRHESQRGGELRTDYSDPCVVGEVVGVVRYDPHTGTQTGEHLE